MGFIFVSVISKTVLTHFSFFRPRTFPVPVVFPFLTSFLKQKTLFLPFLTSITIFFLFYICQVFALLERVTTLTSVSQLEPTSLSLLTT